MCDNLRKLTLKFRPDDALCKGANGVRKDVSGLVLKIKVKKKSKEVVSHEILGHIKQEYQFHAMCDFQYLPVDNGIDIQNKLVPTSLDTEWFNGDCPYLVVPPLFSRIDTIQNYYYCQDKEAESQGTSNVITTKRKKRFGLARFLSFEEKDVPTIPRIIPPLIKPQQNSVSEQELQHIRKLFEERPIFSKSALAGVAGYSVACLKVPLSMVAYHFNNGPWRAMWVRFGYDPRIDPAARMYQTLDFRVKLPEEEASVIGKKSMRYAYAVPRTPKKAKLRSEVEAGPTDEHIFHAGRLPPGRQFFYQYCDLHLPEVQALLETAEVRSVCDPTDGWWPEGTSFACRRIMSQYVTEECARLKQGDITCQEYVEQSQSDSSSSSDEDMELDI